MVSVIKRSGKKQAFSLVKIKNAIGNAARDARVAPRKAEELVGMIVKPVSDLAKAKRVIKVVDIRRSILGRLDRRLKSVSNAWRKHEKKNK